MITTASAALQQTEAPRKSVSRRRRNAKTSTQCNGQRAQHDRPVIGEGVVCVQQEKRSAEDDEHNAQLNADEDATEGSSARFPFTLESQGFYKFAAGIGGDVVEQRLGVVDAVQELGLKRGLEARHEEAADRSEDRPGQKGKKRADE